MLVYGYPDEHHPLEAGGPAEFEAACFPFSKCLPLRNLSDIVSLPLALWSLGQAQFFFSFELSYFKITPEWPALSKF
jgi:hypothetical protein